MSKRKREIIKINVWEGFGTTKRVKGPNGGEINTYTV